MTKSKNKIGKGGLLLGIIILAILIIGFAIISVPAICISGTIIYLFIYLYYRTKITGKMSDFWLTRDEKEDFKKTAATLQASMETIKKSNITGDNEVISRNADGSFSQNENRGKELKSIIDNKQSTINQNNDHLQYLAALPKTRWKKFRNAYSRFYSFLFASLAWIVTATIMIFKNLPDLKEGLNLIANAPKDIFKINGVIFGSDTTLDINFVIQWKILISSAIVCILVYFISIFIFRILVKKLSPVPVSVNLENYDSF